MTDFYDILKDNLYDSFVKILGVIGKPEVEVVFSNENILEPEKTYVVVDILKTIQDGMVNEASFIDSESDILESMTHYQLMTQISFVGKSAGNLSHTFTHHFKNNRACFEVLTKNGIGILSRGDLRSNPQKRETEWVDSYNFDTNLSFAIFTRQSFDWVEYITINGETIRIWNA